MTSTAQTGEADAMDDEVKVDRNEDRQLLDLIPILISLSQIKDSRLAIV